MNKTFIDWHYKRYGGMRSSKGKKDYAFSSDQYIETGWDSYPYVINAIPYRTLYDPDGKLYYKKGGRVVLFMSVDNGYIPLKPGEFGIRDATDEKNFYKFILEAEPVLGEKQKGLGVFSVIKEAIENNSDKISFDNVDVIPKSIMAVENMIHLEIRNCDIEIPEWISELSSLESLLIDNVRNINKLIKKMHCLSKLKKLSLLNIDTLFELPQSLLALTELEELNISAKILDIYPSFTSRMPSLKNMTYGDFVQFPEDSFQIPEILDNN